MSNTDFRNASRDSSCLRIGRKTKMKSTKCSRKQQCRKCMNRIQIKKMMMLWRCFWSLRIAVCCGYGIHSIRLHVYLRHITTLGSQHLNHTLLTFRWLVLVSKVHSRLICFCASLKSIQMMGILHQSETSQKSAWSTSMDNLHLIL